MTTNTNVASLVKDIHDAIAEIAGVARYPDLTEATVSEGGVVAIRWSANSTRQITPELVGQLCALEGTEVKLLLMTPPDTSDAIDGTGADFAADHPLFGQEEEDAADAFAAAEEAGQNYDASEVAKPRRNKNRPSLTPID